LQEAADLIRAAQVLFTQRQFAEAERLYLQGLALLLGTTGEDDLVYSVCLNNLAMLYHVMGDDARAEPLLHEVVEIRRRILGEEHPRYLHSLQDLAEFYRSRNDLTQAEVWQRRADEVEKKLQSP
jgi:tetratricopeptide (TPR) repeat protein